MKELSEDKNFDPLVRKRFYGFFHPDQVNNSGSVYSNENGD